jgi:hypothetical protein
MHRFYPKICLSALLSKLSIDCFVSNAPKWNFQDMNLCRVIYIRQENRMNTLTISEGQKVSKVF